MTTPMHHSNFVHLHVHSYYSLLDGACSIAGLAEKAKAYRMPALALTDHGNLFGAIEFYETISQAGVKPILGCECYLLPSGSRLKKDLRQGPLSHLTLLVKNRLGYQNLCRLISSSYIEGFYYKPRIDMDILSRYTEGLVALSGCLKGALPTLLLENRDEEARSFAEELSRLFGDGRLYLEVMDHGLPDQRRVNEKLVDLAQRKGWPLIATNDVHFLQQRDADAQDVLLCIQTGKTVQDEHRMRMGSDQFYFKSPEEMRLLFQGLPEALDNTVHLAASLNLELDFHTYHFPKFVPPEQRDLGDYLEQLAEQGLAQRLTARSEQAGEPQQQLLQRDYESRLASELMMIKQMGFASYFLIVADFIRYAREQHLPVGPGRGSAAGSLVAFCLRITDIDPLPHDLLFERFLNPERISMPDVDIDFCMRRRDEVIHYVAEKYGNVSQIITFGKMKARAVVRDVGRALAMPYGEVDKIAKLVPATLNMTLEKALEIEPRLLEMAKTSPAVAKLLDVARRLEGFPRHASTHAAGVVISDLPLTEYLPLCLGQRDEVVTQFDMKAVEKVGLIKFDFLGLKTLTVIDDALALIKLHQGIDVNINSIRLDDAAVYARLCTGDTAGIFQLESQGMTALMMKLKPTVFAEIVALVALFRPGPLGSGMVDDYIDRKHGRIPIRYELPQLEPILKDTYGVIVYQEQVMRIASELGGFSLGEADILRRAMGKKKPEEMAKQRERFLEGAKKKRIPGDKAERIFDLMAKFAEYGFNKSHSAAYALVSYQTAYLKCHHTTEYLAALLTSEHGNTDKVLQFIADCRTQAITVLPPDVNESDRDFSIVGEKTIRFGLGAVKNVGEAAIESILEAREAAGHFATLIDFCRRIDARKVNKRVIESLIKCGAFDFTGERRAHLMAGLDQTMNFASSHQRDRQTGQSSLFGGSAETALFSASITPPAADWSEGQLLAYEKEALGFYITGHPLAQYEELLKIYASVDTASIAERGDKRAVRLGGMVTRLREITTKRGDRMAFAAVEDLKGIVEVVVFSDVYAEASALLKAERPIFIAGMADVDEETVKVIAERICPLDEVMLHFTKSVHFYLHSPEVGSHHLVQLKNILSAHPGNCPGFVHLMSHEKAETVLELPSELKISATPQLIASVQKIFGHDVTRFSPI